MGAAYIALSWLVIQVIETLFPLFGFSDAAARAFILILAIGFIPALIFAWVFELTPEGLKRDTEVDHDSTVSRRMTRRFDALIILFLVLSVGYFALDKFVLAPQQQAHDLATATEEALQEGRNRARVAPYGGKSIAVLPFVNMSSDPEQEYFGEGIAEELLNRLAHIPQLRVISRSSAFSFKGSDIDVPTIAKKLNVAHILEGSVRRSGDRIRITAQLIEAGSDTHLWSETYDRPLVDIYVVQDEVAAKVVRQLRLTLLDSTSPAPRANPQAYVLFLQAQQISTLQRQDYYPKALALVEQALEISPDYVDALVLQFTLKGSAGAYQVGGATRDEPEEDEALDRILTLDPDNPQIKSWMAGKRASEGDFTGAARLLEEAADSDPYDPFVLFNSARLADAIGKTGLAVRLGEYIATRDPLIFWAQLNLAGYYFRDGRIEDALRQYETTLSINEKAGAVRWKYGLARLMAGNPEDSLAEFERDENPVYRLHGQVLAYHDLGREEESAAALRELTKTQEEVWPYGLARAHAWIGNPDEAFRYLEATVERTPGFLADIATNPLFQRIQDDPRWLVFLRSNSLAPEQLAAFKFNVEPPD
ncbi:MAG: tetratricopeptide repeat protein [Gammaproteobacteria bacterium]|nr:tetratricopeptide repeat protein [Gammaproteobacteria bacterium]